jgi:hypothetical protein
MASAESGEDMTAAPAAGDQGPPPPAEPKQDRARTKRRKHRTGIGGRLVLLLLVFGVALGVYGLVGRQIGLPVWAVAEIEARVNAGLAGALPQGAVSVSGIEVMIGEDWVPHLVMEDVRLLKPGGQTLLSLPEVHVALDAGALMQGVMRARTIRIVGARLAVRRDREGHFDLNLGSGDGPHIDSLAAFFEAADRAFAQPALEHLTTIDLQALSLSLTDLREGRTWQVGDGRLAIENRKDALAAELGMSLMAGGGTAAQVVMTVVSVKGAGSARITAQVDQLAARDLASQTALLGWLGILDAPISGQIAATIDTKGIQALSGRLDIGPGALQPSPTTTPIPFDQASLGLGYDPAAGRILLTELSVQSETLRVSASGRAYMVDEAGKPITGVLSGRRPAAFLGQMAISGLAVDPAGLFERPVQFSQGAIDLRLRLDPFVLDVGQMTMVEGDKRLSVKGQLAADAGGWRTAMDVSVNEVTLEGLLALWPVRLVPNTRAWIANNIRNAVLNDVQVALRIRPGSAPVVELGYSFSNADLRFMARMPPISTADGYATIVGQAYTFVVTKGVVTPPEGGGVDVAGTVITVPDISVYPATADVRLQARAPLTAILSLLDQPPFHYMEKAGQPVGLGTGMVEVEAWISLPLIQNIPPEQVKFAVTAKVADFVSDLVVPGRTITAPLLTVVANPGGMTIAGPGRIGQVPFDVTFAQGFGTAPPPARIEGTVTLSQATVAEFGLGLPESMVTGEGRGQVEIVLPRDAAGRLRLTSDLRGVVLAIPELGWRKGANAVGRLEAEVALGAVPQVTALAVSGAGLTATGRVDLKSDGTLDRARFDRVMLGGWLDGAVDITGRGARPVGLAVTSGSIDIRRFPENRGSSGSAGGSPITVRLEALRVTDGIRLTGFEGNFALSGGFNGDFSGRINGKAAVTGAVVPSPNGTAVRIISQDAGDVMKSAGMFSSAFGGSLDLTLIPRKTAGVYDGTAMIENLRVRYGSVMADLLSAISIVGLLDQLNGDGIVFANAQADFVLTPKAIEVQKGSAVGASMGVSLEGIYHSDTSRLDMRGVVSPIYLLNGIGAILTRKGEGLFGFAYRLRGTAEAPDVQVNPLSILTPGMFRDLFRAPPPTLKGEGG